MEGGGRWSDGGGGQWNEIMHPCYPLFLNLCRVMCVHVCV